MDHCDLEVPIIPYRMKFLQDVCGESRQCPDSYRITGIIRGRRYAVGGEASIYSGRHGERDVAIREFHPPGQDGDWSTPDGIKIIKESPLFLFHSAQESDHYVYSLRTESPSRTAN